MRAVNKNIAAGFTLIEIMVVIAIIGILAAVAIPQFASYRQRSFISALQSDMHTFANAQEAYYVANDTYCSSQEILENNTYGAMHSANTDDIDITVTITASASDFDIILTDTAHSISVHYDSDAGGLQ